jgi:hypothetical protein
LLVFVFCQLPASAAVFQHAVAANVAGGKESTAYLWLPPEAQQVRGVVMSGMTLMEREFVKDARIRQACAAERLAIVFLKCGLGAVDVQKVLDDLAKVSGYRELSAAPLMFVGHSAGGPQAKGLAVKMAPRCFGLVQYRGGVPGGPDAVGSGVPALMMVGEFDEFGGTMRNEAGRETWEGGRDALAAFRREDERRLASIVVEPGAGHFGWSDRNAAYLALWIRKAAQARIPASWPGDAAEPVALKEIDFHSGWLSDLTIKAPGQFPPAPYDKYQGDKSNAAWHFDQEIADATVAYHAGGFGKKDQFIKWNDPYSVDAGARFFFSKITWVGDGQTFEVHPAYADAYPVRHPSGGPRWAQAGQPAGRSTAPILVKQVGGPVAAAGPNTLRIKYDCLAPATEASRPTFMAFSTGDGQYRYTEMVGMLPRGFAGLKSGKPQTIAFPPVGNLKAGGSVVLKATSDSGLPVEYYVAYGPATVVGGKLETAEIPARAPFPIAVKVVACQFGSGVEPTVQTAVPVERTISIEKP